MSRRTLVCVVLALVAAFASVAAAPASLADPEWASVEDATIRPGARMVTDGSGCTSNFVFVTNRPSGAVDKVILGYAGHCSTSSSGATRCLYEALPLGTPVEIEGASQPGKVVYNASGTMAAVGEFDDDVCEFNDLSLVELHPDDWASVNPTVPFFGGPLGMASEVPLRGSAVYAYGNSGLRQGIEEFKPKYGRMLETGGSGWAHQHYQVTPGIPGDSGSGVLDADGFALAVMSTVTVFPTPASNTAIDLGLALDYVREHVPSLRSIRLAVGTEPFDDSIRIPG